MANTMEIVEELKLVPYFRELGNEPLREIAKACREKHLEKGQMLFFENDVCDGFYYVRSGTVKLYKVSSSGREQIFHTFKAGDTFAEVPTFDDGLCPVNAQALERSTVLLIRKRDFEKIIRAYPEVALGLLHHFARWLRRFTIQLEELSLKDVSARLAGYLLRQAAERGKRTPDGVVVTLDMNQQEIAANIGTVREIVSRNFRKFQELGLIRLKGRRLTILDRDGLEEIS